MCYLLRFYAMHQRIGMSVLLTCGHGLPETSPGHKECYTVKSRKEEMRKRSERCRSGRSGRSRKPVWRQRHRGFESLPLRLAPRCRWIQTSARKRVFSGVSYVFAPPDLCVCLPVFGAIWRRVRTPPIAGEWGNRTCDPPGRNHLDGVASTPHQQYLAAFNQHFASFLSSFSNSSVIGL